MLYGRVPSLSHLKVIGCLCYVTVMPKQDKFSARAVKCVLLGHGLYQKGYKVYDFDKKQVFISRDIVFHESSFPFLSKEPTELHSITSDHDFFLYSDSSDLIPTPTPLIHVLPELPNPSSSSSAESSSTNVDTHPTAEFQPTSTLFSSEVLSFPTSRKSTRSTKPPIWLKDFIVPHKTPNSTCLYSLSDVMNYG